MAPPVPVTADSKVDAGPPAGDPREELELRLLLEAVFQLYGFDFREYALSSLRRRVRHLMRDEGLSTISALQDRVLHDAKALPWLVNGLSVSVTSMYRDPGFFRAFRQQVVPLLRTYPGVRIWHAGCCTGEEVYAMAVLLEEEADQTLGVARAVDRAEPRRAELEVRGLARDRDEARAVERVREAPPGEVALDDRGQHGLRQRSQARAGDWPQPERRRRHDHQRHAHQEDASVHRRDRDDGDA